MMILHYVVQLEVVELGVKLFIILPQAYLDCESDLNRTHRDHFSLQSSPVKDKIHAI